MTSAEPLPCLDVRGESQDSERHSDCGCHPCCALYLSVAVLQTWPVGSEAFSMVRRHWGEGVENRWIGAHLHF